MSHHGADSAPRFDLGRLLITTGAGAELTAGEIKFALLRHRCGDWGEIGDEDAARNDVALETSGRLVSVFISKRLNRFYVITEADRSETTILLPHEY